MSEKTAEERAQVACDGMFDWGTILFSVADQIRAAVEAERNKSFEHGFHEGWRSGVAHPELTEEAALSDFQAAIRKETS